MVSELSPLAMESSKRLKTKRLMTSTSLGSTSQKRMLEKIVQRQKLIKTAIRSTNLNLIENGTLSSASVLEQKTPSVNLKFSEGVFLR